MCQRYPKYIPLAYFGLAQIGIICGARQKWVQKLNPFQRDPYFLPKMGIGPKWAHTYVGYSFLQCYVLFKTRVGVDSNGPFIVVPA